MNDYKSKFLEADAQSNRNFARYEKKKAQSNKNFARYEREKKRAEEGEFLNTKLRSEIDILQSKLAELNKRTGTEGLNDLADERTSLSILGLNQGYTNNNLKKAYARLVNRYHPDKHVHMPSSFVILAEIEFKKVKSAYERLK